MHICEQCRCAEKIGVRCLKSGKFELAISGDKKVVIFVRVSVCRPCLHHVITTGDNMKWS